MGGLLDFLNTDQGRMGLGLLAAAGPRSDGAGFGQRLQEGMGQFDAYKANALKQKMLEAQMQQAMEQAAQQKADRARKQTIQQGMSQFFKPGQAAQPATAPVKGFTSIDSMLPPEMQIGSPGRAAMPAVAPSFDAEGAAQFLAQNGEYEKALPMLQSLEPKERTLSEGQTVFRGDKPILSVPKAPKEIDPNKPFMVIDGKIVPNNAYQDFDLRSKRAGATNVSVPINTGQKGFDNTLKLRGDFRSEPIYKAHQEVQSAYSQIQQSLKMASPVGDLAGATKIMKLLDPGSVVRESELGMAMAASGAMDRLTNYAANVINGTKLTPTQRLDFQKLADALYKESANQYNSKRAEYQGISERNGLNVQDVLGNESNKSPATMRFNPKTNKLEAM